MDMQRPLCFIAKLAFSAVSLFFVTQLYAEETPSYIDGSKPFVSIKDINREAEAWATCAAAYDIMAEILESQPAQAQQMKELANGAEIAVIMALVIDDLKQDITPEKFNALWSFAKVAGREIPKTRRTTMLAEAEALGPKGENSFVDKMAATVKNCVKNLESQQTYIDSWRELAKSGLLKLPEN